MNTKPITSVTLILIGNMLITSNSINNHWTAKIIAIIGVILFFVGLSWLKSFLDDKGQKGVSKLIWAAILGIIAVVLSLIPVVGKIPAGIINLIAFILQLVGLFQLKQSRTLDETGKTGINFLLIAIGLMIFASIIGIIPFVGNTFRSIASLIAFILIPFGWLKIQEAIIGRLQPSDSSMNYSSSQSQTVVQESQKSGDFDFIEWIYKYLKIIIGIIIAFIVFAVLYLVYVNFIKP